MRLRVGLVVALAAAAASVPAAAVASGVVASFLGQSHTAVPGTAWAYYVHASQDGKPWHGTVIADVETPKGQVVDHVGQFAFSGSWLNAYLWNAKDRGLYLFKITFVENHRTVATTSYRVHLT